MRLPRKLKKGCRTLNGNPRTKWQRKGRLHITKMLNDAANSACAAAVGMELLRRATARINPDALPSGGIAVPPPPKVGVAQMPTDEMILNREQAARLKHVIEFKPTKKYADIFTARYECDDYACMAHPNGCFFCEHLSDVFWDYTHGPYMFFCDQLDQPQDDLTPKGLLGQCQYFKREEKQN